MDSKKAYLADGTEVVVVEQCKTGAIVQVVYGGEDDEPRFGDPKFVKRVYSTDAVPMMLPELKRRREESFDLLGKVTVLRSELATLEAERKRLLTKLSQVPALGRIEAILDGRMQYYVREDYCHVSVHHVDDLIAKDDYGREERPRKWKLLTMFGSNHHDLEVRIHQYYDGSGNSTYQCWLFETREEAVAFAADRIDSKFQSWQENRRGDLKYIIESYKQIGVDAPAVCSVAYEAQKAQIKADRIAKLKKELEEATNA